MIFAKLSKSFWEQKRHKGSIKCVNSCATTRTGSIAVFQGQYRPSLSINYLAIKRDLEKLTPQLY